MYPVFSTSLFLLILGTTSFPGTLNFIGELFNMISLSIVDVVFNGLFVTSIPLTTSYSLFLFKRSCGNIYLNYRNQTMDVSRLYLWIPSAALFPLTATPWSNTGYYHLGRSSKALYFTDYTKTYHWGTAKYNLIFNEQPKPKVTSNRVLSDYL